MYASVGLGSLVYVLIQICLLYHVLIVGLSSQISHSQPHKSLMLLSCRHLLSHNSLFYPSVPNSNGNKSDIRTA